MLMFIIRALLIYWILTILIKLFTRFVITDKNSGTVFEKKENSNTPIDTNFTGKIDDAEFEEIDSE